MVNRRFLLEKMGLLSLAPTLLAKTVNGFDSLQPILPKGIFPPSEYLAHLEGGKAFGIQITPSGPFRVSIRAYSGGSRDWATTNCGSRPSKGNGMMGI